MNIRPNNKSDNKDDSFTLEVLDAVDDKENLTQRHLAQRMGVALGLANSYLKRCINKGLVKVQQIPANRYLYYLTPKGFSEKTRLTAEYFTSSFSFYRQACESCVECFRELEKRKLTTVILAGDSELAEIACLKALDTPIVILGIWDMVTKKNKLSGKPIYTDLKELPEFDVFLMTDLASTDKKYKLLCKQFGAERIYVPELLENIINFDFE